MLETGVPRIQPDTESYMAIIEVKVPQLSESVAEATLLQWHKKAGEAVGRDENLIDVETDKVVLELPAPEAGVISQIIAPDGATVVAGQVIALIDTSAAAAASPAQAAPAVTACISTKSATRRYRTTAEMARVHPRAHLR